MDDTTPDGCVLAILLAILAWFPVAALVYLVISCAG